MGDLGSWDGGFRVEGLGSHCLLGPGSLLLGLSVWVREEEGEEGEGGITRPIRKFSKRLFSLGIPKAQCRLHL